MKLIPISLKRLIIECTAVEMQEIVIYYITFWHGKAIGQLPNKTSEIKANCVFYKKIIAI